jgi:uncharacterized MAPEG superfamily protein
VLSTSAPATHANGCATRSARGAIQLIDILSGEPSMVGKIDAWNWTKAAVLYHCA